MSHSSGFSGAEKTGRVAFGPSITRFAKRCPTLFEGNPRPWCNPQRHWAMRATEGSARPWAGAATVEVCALWCRYILRSFGCAAVEERPPTGGPDGRSGAARRHVPCLDPGRSALIHKCLDNGPMWILHYPTAPTG